MAKFEVYESGAIRLFYRLLSKFWYLFKTTDADVAPLFLRMLTFPTTGEIDT
jgi:hypothetical protein